MSEKKETSIMSLKGKTAIITGGTRGIGRAIADVFAAQGANIVISATTAAKCQSVAQEIETKFGVKAIGIETNVRDLEACLALTDQTKKEFGQIDILVNNAGITRDNLLLRLKEADWNDVIETNLNSVFNMTKCVIKPMLRQRSGRIINITSVVGLMGNAGQSNYAASKAGVVGFTKSIAREIGAKGITVNAIAPGFVETDMLEALPKEYVDNIIETVPTKRLGRPDDIANAALFLASDLSSYITGQVINVDGGMLM
ncbi:MAG: 3-oxoacyl-[acyl-carrier protein] reductase [Candidatus Marinamargulisbacteria bacterium]|jgi:3-oxoacyl-[acyl-carrier protein] reductase